MIKHFVFSINFIESLFESKEDLQASFIRYGHALLGAGLATAPSCTYIANTTVTPASTSVTPSDSTATITTTSVSLQVRFLDVGHYYTARA